MHAYYIEYPILLFVAFVAVDNDSHTTQLHIHHKRERKMNTPIQGLEGSDERSWSNALLANAPITAIACFCGLTTLVCCWWLTNIACSSGLSAIVCYCWLTTIACCCWLTTVTCCFCLTAIACCWLAGNTFY